MEAHFDQKAQTSLEEVQHDSETEVYDACSVTGSMRSDWTETTNVPRREMGVLQVISLMINQMVGAGIFITPGNVLLLTGSKPISIALWAVGGIYQCLGALMYLEFSSALPFTGGPLIWLDETLHKPKMLAAFIFSWYWIIFTTSGGSCLTVAQYVLALAWEERPFDQFDDGMIRFTAVVVCSASCLCIYFIRRICFMFNGIFAVLKIVFVLVIFACGLKYAATHRADSGLDSFSERRPHSGGVTSLSSIIYITYAFQGWEHTNFIAGEIRRPVRTLAIGVFTTLSIVTCMYIMVAVAFYAAIPYDVILKPDPGKQTGIAFLFADRVFGDTVATTAIAALSAWSSLLALTYADARVKQSIAWQRILPFSTFFGRQDRQFDSPGGALLLHWFVSVISIAVKPYFAPNSRFFGKAFDYIYYFEMGVLFVALPLLAKRMLARTENWRPKFLKQRMVLIPYCLILGGFSFMVVVVTALPNSVVGVPNFYLPVALVSTMIAASLHWGILKCLRMRWGKSQVLGERIGFEVKVYGHNCEDEPPESLQHLIKEAEQDGSRRRIEYTLTGSLKHVCHRVAQVCLFVVRRLQ